MPSWFLVLGSRCPGPPAVSRGPGAPAAASPPVGSPPQYSPALRWVTTGFGMGPGGASALSATGAPGPPTLGGRRRGALASSWCGAGNGRRRGGPPPAARPPRVSSPAASAARRRRRVCVCGGRWLGLGGRRGAVPVVRGDRPRPSARLGSGRLPAVHPPPVNPVVSRGPYLHRVGRLVLGRGSRLDAFSG